MLRKILFFLQKQPDLAVIAPIDYLLDDIQSDSEDLLITEYLSSHLLHEFIDFLLSTAGKGPSKLPVNPANRLSVWGCNLSKAVILTIV